MTDIDTTPWARGRMTQQDWAEIRTTAPAPVALWARSAKGPFLALISGGERHRAASPIEAYRAALAAFPKESA